MASLGLNIIVFFFFTYRWGISHRPLSPRSPPMFHVALSPTQKIYAAYEGFKGFPFKNFSSLPSGGGDLLLLEV